MPEQPQRLRREARTIEGMVRIYCHAHHTTQHDHAGLCPECQSLLDYARVRLSKCPYQAAKPTCAKCPIHCYQSTRREQVRAVMRYAGPRMLLRHPVLALQHLLDGARKPPHTDSTRAKPRR